ncbi:MAG: hypothetical protein RBT49_11155 [Bacteroidales bacterium]|nr:hypothetical protein [Bacteroidales bacterium]
MKVIVPKSVNVKQLLQGLNLSPTRLENLKNKIYYLLSRIVSTNDNFKLNEKNDGYINISSVIMRKVMGRKDYYLILELLSDSGDPIIETNNSWLSSNENNSKGYCKGYRITQRFSTGEVEFKTIPGKLRKRILKHTPDEAEAILMSEKYKFLLEQFKSHTFSFDPQVYNYIRSFGHKLLSMVQDHNEYQTRMVYNLIGRWLYFVEKIENNDLWHNVSASNHRLNSSITSLKRTLRPFLICDGKQLGIIDISASQPYFLSSVMGKGFLTDTGEGFNLRSIYPEVWEEVVSKGCICTNISTTYTGDIFTYNSIDAPTSCNDLLNNCIDYSGSTNNFNNYTSSSPITNSFNASSNSSSSSDTTISPSFMWGPFLSGKEVESIMNYSQSPFDNDFYKHLFSTYQSMTGRIEDFCPEQRQKIKDTMMFILYEDNWKHRNNNENIRMFQMVYPGVDKWIEWILKTIGKSKFSLLLQRAESYLVLGVVCREFIQRHPSVPVFTIHDAVMTHEEYLPDLQKTLLGRFQEITGIKVGIKNKSEKPNPKPDQRDIDKAWSKITRISTEEKFKKKFNGVFVSNIERGSSFLKTHPLERKGLST